MLSVVHGMRLLNSRASLSKGGFRATHVEPEVRPLPSTCLDANKFVLLYYQVSLLTPIETIWAKPLPRNDPINIASWLEFRSYVRVKSLGMRQVGTKSESPEKTR